MLRAVRTGMFISGVTDAFGTARAHKQSVLETTRYLGAVAAQTEVDILASESSAQSNGQTSMNYLNLFTRSDKVRMGNAFEAKQGVLDSYTQFGDNTATQLYMRAFDANGNLLPGSVRMDMVGWDPLNPDLGYDFIDYKLSPNAPLTDNQAVHYPAFGQYGGVITGLRGESIDLPKGTVFGPTPITIRTGPMLQVQGK